MKSRNRIRHLRFGLKTCFALTVFASLSFAVYRHYRVTPAVHPTTFNGTDDVMEIPDSERFDLAGDFTIEAWIRLPPNQSARRFSSCIVRKGAGVANSKANYHLGVLNWNNRLCFNIGDGVGGHQEVFGTRALPALTWTHVAAVRSRDSLSLYINGALDSELSPRTTSQACNDAPLRLGGVDHRSSDFFLAADIDEVRIWGVARTGKQIKKYARVAIPADTADLVFVSKAAEPKL